jgi:allantoinase
MPLNSIPPTVNSDALAEKVAATRGKLWIDVGFHGGIVPGNGSELPRLLREGVVGLKCFLCASGVEEFSPVTLGQLAAAIDGVAGLDPWILVHAESPEVLRSARSELDATSGPWTYDDYLRSRPDEAECLAIRQLIHLVETSAAHIHVVHLSSAVALKSIAEAKTSRLAITAETCPHYLTFDAESIADAATELKCAPPIRSAANREALWSGLKHGIIDIIASDHSPCRTEAHRRGFSLTDLTRWMCRRPAELANLPAKGSIAPGKDADLICFAPDETFVFDEQQILHRHKTTPYSGRRMRGVVKQTFLRGVMIYDRGSWGGGPQGQILRAQPRSAGEIALTS